MPAVEPYGFWAVAFEGVYVSGRNMNISAPRAIVDSGTTLMGGPRAAVEAIYAAIPGALGQAVDDSSQYWTIPCDWEGVVSLVFGGQAYPMNVTAFASGCKYYIGAMFIA